MRLIKDIRFLETLYATFCYRRESRATLNALRIKVTRGAEALDRIRLAVCENQRELIVLGHHNLRGTTVLRIVYSDDNGLADANRHDRTQEALTKLVHRFLRRHRILVPAGGRELRCTLEEIVDREPEPPPPIDPREFAGRFLGSAEYLASLRRRIAAGTLPAPIRRMLIAVTSERRTDAGPHG